MTTIAAAATGPRPIIGSDGMVCHRGQRMSTTTPKILDVWGYRVGWAGEWRYGELLARMAAEGVPESVTCQQFHPGLFIEALHDQMVKSRTLDHHAILSRDTGTQTEILVLADDVWHIDSQLDCFGPLPFWAIGSGGDLALGAMHAADNMHDEDPEENRDEVLVVNGLQAACDIDTHSGGRHTIREFGQ